MISLTPKAIEKIEEMALEEDIGHFSIRLKILGGGCAGMTYDMYFDDIIKPLDEITYEGNVQVLVDALSLQYLDGTTIDYHESSIGGGFKFLNPQVTTVCGCGNSVGF